MADVHALMAQLPVILSDGWQGDCEPVLARAYAAVKDGSCATKRLTGCINTAIKARERRRRLMQLVAKACLAMGRRYACGKACLAMGMRYLSPGEQLLPKASTVMMLLG
mgnify:CR=1 FL=1